VAQVGGAIAHLNSALLSAAVSPIQLESPPEPSLNSAIAPINSPHQSASSVLTIKGHDFRGQQLEGHDFRGHRLINVDFEGTNLTGANFAGLEKWEPHQVVDWDEAGIDDPDDYGNG